MNQAIRVPNERDIGTERPRVHTTTIEEIAKTAQELDRGPFVERHPNPFLILDALSGDQKDHEVFQTVSGKKSPIGKVRTGPPSPRTKVAVVVKREGANGFTNMVTIGRAGNNDITLEIASISKFHAYITNDAREGAWFVHDAGSANGTWIDGQKLTESQGKLKLSNGSFIQLGPDARVRFYEAAALYDLLRTG